MGYFCFCIPLKEYAIFLGICMVIINSIQIILDIIYTDPEKHPFVMVFVMFGDGLALIAAIYLILGSSQRRHQYIAPCLMLAVIAVLYLLLMILYMASKVPDVAKNLLAWCVLYCLLGYPIYLWYVEIKNENRLNVESTGTDRPSVESTGTDGLNVETTSL